MAANTTAPKVSRLLDLPPELRCYIYAYALNGASRRGAFFRFPALIRVSRQVRRESLPIFFADSNFAFDVGTNFMALDFSDAVDGRDLPMSRELDAGRIFTNSAVKRFMREAFFYMIFRNITFHVHPSSNVYHQRYAGESFNEALLAITLTVYGDKVKVKVAPSGGHPIINRRTYTERDCKMLDFIGDCVIAEAKVVEARKGFKGFTMSDLKDIAFACRFQVKGSEVGINSRRART